MPKLAIMAVLAYQAASYDPIYNLIDSGLQDNYSLAVAAGKTPAIAPPSISTGCLTFSETGAAEVFDNDIMTKGDFDSDNNCIKSYKLDFSTYATSLGSSPRVRTASFKAQCHNLGAVGCYI
jgi:hypothetical protein